MRFRILVALPWVALLAAIGVQGAAGARVKRIVGGRTAVRPTPATPRPEVRPVQPIERPDETTAPPVATLYSDDGRVTARVIGVTEDKTKPPYYSFKGIRYAWPPVGWLRFQRPRKLPLEGEVVARQYGAPCVQPNPYNPQQVIGSEDCLFLNVFTPKLPPSRVSQFARVHDFCADDEDTLLPVMVWSHGGGYRQGSASQYGPTHLMDKGIVVVTFQYRLGPLGFLSHGNKDSPGNAALCDQLAVLEWVKEHIHAFGGDPMRVSLAGHDAGASAAMLLTQSKHGQGLFRSVVAMSGTSLSAWATESKPRASARSIAGKVKCPTGENNTVETVKCLQEVSAKDLVISGMGMAMSQLAPGDAQGDFADMFSSLAPVVDGPTDSRSQPTILEEGPKESLEGGRLPSIPLLTGITKDETSNLFSKIQKSSILQKMKEIPGYLDNIFLPQLVKSTKGLTNLTTSLTQTLTGYLGVIPGESTQGALSRLIEASSDALFALPAFLTSSLWQRSGGPVFLYSFDHPSPFSASVFSSSPFTSLAGEDSKAKDANDKSVGHGEDLFYLFEPMTLEGEKQPSINLTKQDDKNVLNLLTSMVAKFVKTGNPSIELEGQESAWLPFTGDQNNYLSISSKPTVGSQFKFCQMGLWSGISSRLLSPECSDAFSPTVLLQPLAPPLQGLLAGGSQPQPTQQSQRTPPRQGGGLSIPGFLG
ncbi:carboxylesterase 4A [Ischnura elegans]|uniref:carboxylesterase 4A n=1 Tax=Ischnura elegans TaxID=197161 RepID=UPI001ED8A949|nr:carboxylesterase 4A [Ischnura elegans]